MGGRYLWRRLLCYCVWRRIDDLPLVTSTAVGTHLPQRRRGERHFKLPPKGGSGERRQVMTYVKDSGAIRCFSKARAVSIFSGLVLSISFYIGGDALAAANGQVGIPKRSGYKTKADRSFAYQEARGHKPPQYHPTRDRAVKPHRVIWGN